MFPPKEFGRCRPPIDAQLELAPGCGRIMSTGLLSCVDQGCEVRSFRERCRFVNVGEPPIDDCLMAGGAIIDAGGQLGNSSKESHANRGPTASTASFAALSGQRPQGSGAAAPGWPPWPPLPAHGWELHGMSIELRRKRSRPGTSSISRRPNQGPRPLGFEFEFSVGGTLV